MRRTILLLVVASTLASGAMAQNRKQSDCVVSNAHLPRGVTRIFIAQHSGVNGTLDGSTAERFDHILRCYSEGCDIPGGKPIKATENLIVCLRPGTFLTKGTYDFVINVPHKTQDGFTVGKGWHIHGAGVDQTTVKLAAYLPFRAHEGPANMPVNSGVGVVFSTNSDQASGVEISDLTIDANYPELKKQATAAGIKALNLEAIHLRSDQGGHWIHDVRIINAAGEIGAINGHWETFPVWIVSMKNGSIPQQDNGNMIERVSMSTYGGGACTAIAVANAVAEVRNNRVEGYGIAFGGWTMGPVWFHDNIAIGTDYGFNIDSLTNQGVKIERNQIIHPRRYGIVIGGDGTYSNFKIVNNSIEIDQPGVVGLIFRGNVTSAEVAGNSILAPPGVKASAISNYAASLLAKPNLNNAYQSNRISSQLQVSFRGLSWKSRSCIAGNQDERGNPSKSLSDNHSGPCAHE